uniref:CBY1 interacting BAR domain containing 2 n=1 Tax=Myripristis murdjan TaxID=586833 RepID=A0A667X6M1_9TELE
PGKKTLQLMTLIIQTVNHAEKHLGRFCSLLASYTRKTAKLRDKGDLLVAQLFDFSSTEDPALRVGLKNLAEDLAMVQDYRQAQVERLETRVVAPLKAYGDIVKSKRVSTDVPIKLVTLTQNKSSFQCKPLFIQRVTQRASFPFQESPVYKLIREVNAQKASNNAQRSTRQLEETINDFQRQKVEEIKRVFTDFITVEMLFHAKALEIYTHTFQNLEAMDINKDLEMEMTVHVLFSTHLDYCNSLFTCVSKSSLSRLQLIQNAGARILAGTGKCSHNHSNFSIFLLSSC